MTGIIPARAGFTCITGRLSLPRRDHPRSRGVYSSGITGDTERAGSSPLARGLLVRTRCVLGDDGIIPARAGFTQIGIDAFRRYSDHPRSRGVYTGAPQREIAIEGSSPLARGLLDTLFTAKHISGIIPARAGFT